MGLLGVAWSNILVGVLAALLVGAASWTKDYAHDKYLERKFPIGGEYITTFEDQEGDNEFVVTAPAKLEQRGRKITGQTAMPNDDRQWILEGELSEEGYINGLYYAVDPHDKGVGNFFLYVNYDRNMEGLWSGYDEVNGKISSGRYTFRPVFDAFQMEPLRSEKMPAVIDIADQRLGKDYLSTDLLSESLDEESQYFTRIAVVDSGFSEESSLADQLAESIVDRRTPNLDDTVTHTDIDSSEIIGFSVGAVMDQDALRSYLNVSASELPDGLRHSEAVGVVRTIAVRDGFEQRGVGTAIVEDCIDECLERDATALCAIGWEDDGKVNIGGIMEHFEFDEADRLPEYWHDESLEKGYHCENCGSPPCTCSAVLFTKYP